jgi:hypothetical protein
VQPPQHVFPAEQSLGVALGVSLAAAQILRSGTRPPKAIAPTSTNAIGRFIGWEDTVGHRLQNQELITKPIIGCISHSVKVGRLPN